MNRSVCFLLALWAAGSTVAAQPYRDVALEAGLGAILRASGAAVADIDLDGDLDLYVVSPEERVEGDPTTYNHLFRNLGDGTFENITAGSGIEPFDGGYRRGQQGNRFGVAWGDYDGDRLPDLFLARVGPERLYRNRGDGTFEDVTVQAGVFGRDDTANDVAGAWTDLDGDGDLDLYVSAWIGPNRYYRNEGDGTFTEMAAELGIVDGGFTWGVLPWDVDEDGRLDLYVVNDFGPNRLYVQQTDGTFLEDTDAWAVGDPGNGMGVALADVNDDGRGDIYVTNIYDRQPNPLYVRHGQQYIDRASDYGVQDAGWAWGVEFFDADHDGDLDLYVVNGFPTDPATNRFFERDGAGFTDVSMGSGTDGAPEARALVVFDREGDGDLDLFVGNFRAPSVLLDRDDPAGNWIGFDLDQPGMNRWAVGAEILLESGGRTMRRYLDGMDMLGQSLVPAHFGLGSSETAERVEVHWPDGVVEVWLGLEAGRYHTLVRGTSTAVETPPDASGDAAPWPNPAAGWVTVPAREGAVEIYDVLGRRRAHRPLDARGRVSLEGMPPGVLFLRTARGAIFSVMHTPEFR
ncbi:MAG: CRTAC1 family protein [Rhodothermales bacterium]|nr:CRTAC1 family protein [Rhodothermales bacterium]MBO6779448.1 CRTAC1 family protein [Rhodothermales bacterium]